eukprot:CAMPEP_0176454732 /NCGR_PEP_ID=MMETSP0127-20121128/30159_1 /TAXON_ID=938130 /ORGANISM="Platyophrya macrostoma, Strain WH" /LENGTH=70 /DNA_ID=CAMNT_0017844139 /DNA_START=143 /DNA_END=351 /DNA_ORIENTATION=-
MMSNHLEDSETFLQYIQDIPEPTLEKTTAELNHILAALKEYIRAPAENKTPFNEISERIVGLKLLAKVEV